MNNLSELFMRSTPTPAALRQSEAWAKQALSLLQKTQANAGKSDDVRVCEDALAVVLFNLGSLREVCTLPILSDIGVLNLLFKDERRPRIRPPAVRAVFGAGQEA